MTQPVPVRMALCDNNVQIGRLLKISSRGSPDVAALVQRMAKTYLGDIELGGDPTSVPLGSRREADLTLKE